MPLSNSIKQKQADVPPDCPHCKEASCALYWTVLDFQTYQSAGAIDETWDWLPDSATVLKPLMQREADWKPHAKGPWERKCGEEKYSSIPGFHSTDTLQPVIQSTRHLVALNNRNRSFHPSRNWKFKLKVSTWPPFLLEVLRENVSLVLPASNWKLLTTSVTPQFVTWPSASTGLWLLPVSLRVSPYMRIADHWIQESPKSSQSHLNLILFATRLWWLEWEISPMGLGFWTPGTQLVALFGSPVWEHYWALGSWALLKEIHHWGQALRVLAGPHS